VASRDDDAIVGERIDDDDLVVNDGVAGLIQADVPRFVEIRRTCAAV